MSYGQLVQSRKDCFACSSIPKADLRNGSGFAFDPAVVSHWSQWLGHQSPRLTIVGQDFSDVEYFKRNQGLDNAKSPTNTRLRTLLAEAGILAGSPPFRDDAAPVYLTNSILCLKAGGMAASIQRASVRNCARKHLGPLLDHLRAPAVVAMGGHALLALRLLFPELQLPDGIKAAAGKSWQAPSGPRVFAVGHCSGLGLANRPWQQQLADWREIGRVLNGPPSDPGTENETASSVP